MVAILAGLGAAVLVRCFPPQRWERRPPPHDHVRLDEEGSGIRLLVALSVLGLCCASVLLLALGSLWAALCLALWAAAYAVVIEAAGP